MQRPGTIVGSGRHDAWRWLFSGLLAAVAVWSLAAVSVALVRVRAEGWGTVAFLSAFGLAVVTPFALGAYFCFTRRYGDLFMVGAAVAALVLLSLALSIPDRLGVVDALRDRVDNPLWTLAVGMVLLVGPFCLSGWFLRACSRFAARRIPNGGEKRPPGLTPGVPGKSADRLV
jgi:hypothetical protein